MSAADLWFDRNEPGGVIEAIGALALIHTEMETTLLGLLGHFLNLKFGGGVLGHLFTTLSNRSRIDLIKRLASTEGHDSAETDAVEYAARCFDICAENRNIVAHSTYQSRQGHRFVFFKLPTTPGASGWYWALDDIDMSHIVLEAIAADDYILMLWNTLRQGKPASLPEKPLQPRKLSLFRLPKDHPDAKPPPQS